MKSIPWRLIPLIVFIVLLVFFGRGLWLDPQHLPSVQLGKALPTFQLPVLGDAPKKLSPADFQGSITLLNVWASWCDACTEEQHFLMQLARDGVVIYGLNYKDHPDDAKKWLTEWGNPYRLVGSDVSGKVAIDLGVYGTPETFLIDKTGVIRYRHVGLLNPTVWRQVFVPMMKQLEQTI